MKQTENELLAPTLSMFLGLSVYISLAICW